MKFWVYSGKRSFNGKDGAQVKEKDEDNPSMLAPENDVDNTDETKDTKKNNGDSADSEALTERFDSSDTPNNGEKQEEESSEINTGDSSENNKKSSKNDDENDSESDENNATSNSAKSSGGESTATFSSSESDSKSTSIKNNNKSSGGKAKESKDSEPNANSSVSELDFINNARKKMNGLMETKNSLKDSIEKLERGENNTVSEKLLGLFETKEDLIDYLKSKVDEIDDGLRALQRQLEKIRDEKENSILNASFSPKDNDEYSRSSGIVIERYNSFSDTLPTNLVRTLINKFLTEKFKKTETNLNRSGDSLDKANGFLRWDNKEVAKHLKSKQYTKILTDKYGYSYENGKQRNIPLAFYIDLSGSMVRYSYFLATLAIELVKNDVKVILGFNNKAVCQVEWIKKGISVQELANILRHFNTFDKQENISKIKVEKISKKIDEYLLSAKTEKLVAFSDFDAVDEISRISKKAQTYFFCFEQNVRKNRLKNFKGYFKKVSVPNDLMEGLAEINKRPFGSFDRDYFEERG